MAHAVGESLSDAVAALLESPERYRYVTTEVLVDAHRSDALCRSNLVQFRGQVTYFVSPE